jgi:hypothetical protein
VEEIKFLSIALSKIKIKIEANKESLFDHDVNEFVRDIQNGNHLKILFEKPREFFTILDQFLWKIDDENLKEIKQENGEILIKYMEKLLLPPLVEYEGGTKYSMKNEEIMVVKEYIEARKMINEFIKVLKIEIVYGQSIQAFK